MASSMIWNQGHDSTTPPAPSCPWYCCFRSYIKKKKKLFQNCGQMLGFSFVLNHTLYLVLRLSHFLAICSEVSLPSRPRPLRMVLMDTHRSAEGDPQGPAKPYAWATYLQAILAEFLFPVNSASLDALNSINLFTSSSVTGNGGAKGQKPLVLQTSSLSSITYFYSCVLGTAAAD